MPCPVHVLEGGAVHVSVYGHGGAGACGRDVFPALWHVGGKGHWALTEGCEGQGNLPSDASREDRDRQ